MDNLLCLFFMCGWHVIASYSKKHIVDTKQKLSNQFDMKDLGDANHILGMRITRDCMNGSIACILKLCKDDYPEEKATMVQIPYASACGSLMYAMVATIPDIAYAVGVVNRYMSNPRKKHWDVVKSTLLKHLSGQRIGNYVVAVENYPLRDILIATLLGALTTVDWQLCYGCR